MASHLATEKLHKISDAPQGDTGSLLSAQLPATGCALPPAPCSPESPFSQSLTRPAAARFPCCAPAAESRSLACSSPWCPALLLMLHLSLWPRVTAGGQSYSALRAPRKQCHNNHHRANTRYFTLLLPRQSTKNTPQPSKHKWWATGIIQTCWPPPSPQGEGSYPLHIFLFHF